MLYCAGGTRSSIALVRKRRRTVALYNFTKAQKNYKHAAVQYNKSSLQHQQIT